MADIRECSNLVICPQSPWRHLTVYTKVTKDKDGNTVAFCDGCDSCSGSIICMKCVAAITQMYNHDESFPPEPFAPPIHRFDAADQAPKAKP